MHLFAFAAAIPLLSIVLVIRLPNALACNGYKLKVDKLSSECYGGYNSIIKINPNSTFALTNDCVLHPHGCIDITRPFQTAEIHYSMKTKLLLLADDTRDGCKLLEEAADDDEAMLFINMFSLPKSCPVAQKRYCDQGRTVNMKKYQDNFLPGTLQANITILHDHNLRSCLLLEATFEREGLLHF